jgi:hypothetical protein
MHNDDADLGEDDNNGMAIDMPGQQAFNNRKDLDSEKKSADQIDDDLMNMIGQVQNNMENNNADPNSGSAFAGFDLPSEEPVQN